MRRVGDESGDALLMSLTGSSPNDMEEGVVSKGSGLSRGDKRRNAELAELRRLVPAEHVIGGIDLADKTPAVGVRSEGRRVGTGCRAGRPEARPRRVPAPRAPPRPRA